MIRRIFPIFLLLATLQATAQQVVQHKQRNFPKTVPAGNYSGIAWLGGDIEASLVEATAIMSRLLSNEAFMKQLSKAKEEYQKRSVATSSSGG